MEVIMKGELTAILEKAPVGGYWAICPEIPGPTDRVKVQRKPRKA
jgi:hypothetical protein